MTTTNEVFGGLIPSGARAVIDGWQIDDTHHYPMLVQFEDTDAGGIVYHANYLSFAERGRSAWLRLIGIHQSTQIYDKKVGFVVRRAALDYVRPAKLGDELIIQTKMISLGKARLVAEQIICSAHDLAHQTSEKAPKGHIFAKVEVEIVMVNEAGRPVRFAPDLLEKMSSGQVTDGADAKSI